jgi:hypothetical protein
MGHACVFVPLSVFVDSGKGDLPRVSDANFHHQTIASLQISLVPCERAHRRVLDGMAPALSLSKISLIEMILQGKEHLAV